MATAQRIESELRQIVPVLEELTGLRSRWSGVVELVPDAGFRGLKPVNCDILLNSDLAADDSRWRTMIHESLHAMSIGYSISDYNAYQGWEEGVVEALQRRFRTRVLSRLGVSVDEAVFEEIERSHAFNRYILALENIRAALGQTGDDFYIELLRTPIRDRYSFLL